MEPDEYRQRCARYGLRSDEQVRQFAEAAGLLGEEFDSDPEHEWAVEVLTDFDVSPDERAALLLAFASVIAEEREVG